MLLDSRRSGPREQPRSSASDRADAQQPEDREHRQHPAQAGSGRVEIPAPRRFSRRIGLTRRPRKGALPASCRAATSASSADSAQRSFVPTHSATYRQRASAAGGSHWAGTWSAFDRFERVVTATRLRCGRGGSAGAGRPAGRPPRAWPRCPRARNPPTPPPHPPYTAEPAPGRSQCRHDRRRHGAAGAERPARRASSGAMSDRASRQTIRAGSQERFVCCQSSGQDVGHDRRNDLAR